MKEESSFKKFFPFFVIVLLLAVFFLVYKYIKNNKNNLNFDHNLTIKKNYDVNEYVPVFIDNAQMSKKYLIDFLNNVYYDIDGSYQLLNKQYRAAKFGTVGEYKAYLHTLNLSTEIDRFAIYETADYKYYDVYDINGNRFIFRTSGVMQYEVLFDDYTV